MGRIIDPVMDNKQKQQTYARYLGRYNKAVKGEFYFEALLIDYAMLEDRLRSFIYHIGGLRTRDSYSIGKGHVRNKLTEMLMAYRSDDENTSLGITSISGKMKIVRATIRWAMEDESITDEKYLQTLRHQYIKNLDMIGMLNALDEIRVWCDYRNEIIHSLMNKNVDSVDTQLKAQVLKGMELARFIDCQVKAIKKGDRIRRSLGFKDN